MAKPLFNIPGAERQTLDWVLAWHSSIAESLVDHRASVQLAIQTGAPVAPRFTGMTSADVDDHYDEHRRELDRLTMLNLEPIRDTVCSIKNQLRPHFISRIHFISPISSHPGFIFSHFVKNRLHPSFAFSREGGPRIRCG